jgi:predicted transcriptional regulator of viral defense system
MRMKHEAKKLRSRDLLDGLMASGRYTFTSGEAKDALKSSGDATRRALARLAKQGLIASPARGFYVVIPPEYRSLGCLPADQFIPALLSDRGQSYYVGLLSAAQYHGAAHHRPQEFQVMVGKARRQIECGKVRVAFFVKARIEATATQKFNTQRGEIYVSTPEETALDLVGYQENSGGLDNVATILSELADKLEPQKLASAAASSPRPWAQRLGYLLTYLGHAPQASALKELIKKEASQVVALLPGHSLNGANRDHDWRLNINTTIEADT